MSTENNSNKAAKNSSGPRTESKATSALSVDPAFMETARAIVKRCGLRDGLFKGPRTLNAVETIAYELTVAREAGAKAARWQPISTAPKDNSWILALMRTGRQTVVRWGGGTWEDDNRLCRDPVRWMPLPAVPKVNVPE